MNLKVEVQLKTRFPDLTVLTCNIEDVKVEKQTVELEKLKDEITEKVKKYTLDSVKNLAIFKAYRDFFWRIGIYPTKNRPAACMRRVPRGRGIPRINTLVDAYNLASI
jgi:DNA/RNA-binding domain of Phe-tRNA-synthetase-like protein